MTSTSIQFDIGENPWTGMIAAVRDLRDTVEKWRGDDLRKGAAGSHHAKIDEAMLVKLSEIEDVVSSCEKREAAFIAAQAQVAQPRYRVASKEEDTRPAGFVPGGDATVFKALLSNPKILEVLARPPSDGRNS